MTSWRQGSMYVEMKGTVKPVRWMVERMIWLVDKVGVGFSALVMKGRMPVRLPLTI